MELDGREAAASSLEPESGAIAEPHWLWEAIAAAESPVSAEMEDAGDDTNGGPDAGNGQKGDSSAALSGDDQREDSAPGGIDGEFAKLRHMIQESAERTENETFGKLDLMEAQTKTVAEAVAANAAALREFTSAEGRQPEAGGTPNPACGWSPACCSPYGTGCRAKTCGCAGSRPMPGKACSAGF